MLVSQQQHIERGFEAAAAVWQSWRCCQVGRRSKVEPRLKWPDGWAAALPTGNFLTKKKTFAGNACKWIGKCGASGSPEWHFHSVRMASLDLHLCPVWVSSAHLAKCILCQNVQLAVKVTAFNFQPSVVIRSCSPHSLSRTLPKLVLLPCAGVKTSPYFNICLCQKTSGCHNFLAQKVGGVSGCWASRVEGLAGQDGDTPCDRPEPLRIRWSLTLLGRTRSGFSIFRPFN